MKRVAMVFLFVIVTVSMLTVSVSFALHSPIEWYGANPDDANGNKIDDRLEGIPPDSLPEVFVCFKGDCRPDSIMDWFINNGAEIGYESPVIASAAIRGLTLSELATAAGMWDPIAFITPNSVAEFHMNTSGQALGAHAGFYSPTTAEDAGFDGTGILIAIFDSGVRDAGNIGGHPDIPAAIGGISVLNSFTGAITSGNPDDNLGHGTQVAAVALGRGSLGSNRGVAPGAELFDCRVSDPLGSLTLVGIQAAVDWVTQVGAFQILPIRVANLGTVTFSTVIMTYSNLSLELHPTSRDNLLFRRAWPGFLYQSKCAA